MIDHITELANSPNGQGNGVVVAIGRYTSWLILLGVPLVSAGAAASTVLSGANPMWTVVYLVLAIVFLHGSLCVLSDLARLRRQYLEQIIRRRHSL